MKQETNSDPQINRRDFLRTAARGTAAVSLAGLSAETLTAKPKKAKQDKPNILYIFADQLRYSALGSSGNDIVYTPNLDKLAGQGVVFDNAFSSCPICSPYRAQIITGRYSHKNGVMDNQYKPRTDQKTIHHVLKEAGYHTAHIGKWHLGFGPYTKDKRYGLDYIFAHNCNHHYYQVSYYENERGPIETNRWSPIVETDKAIEFMEQHCKKNNGTPFSLFIGWGPPHNGHRGGYGPDDTHELYDQYPGKYNVYDPAEIKLRSNVPRPLAPFTRTEIADYYSNVTGLDEQMGRLIKKLEDLGIAENTIVCFSSDHGDHLRSHGYGNPCSWWIHPSKRTNKATPHEEAIHIPFILRWPAKVKASLRTETMFSSVDVMPTLLSLCGLDIPKQVQGKDLSHAAMGKQGAEPDSVYLQILGPGWPGRKDFVGFWRGVRTKRWVYARWKDNEYGPWLFDREKDPYELDNLAGQKEYAEIQAKMERRLQQWIKETDDPFDTGKRNPETRILQLGQKINRRKDD